MKTRINIDDILFEVIKVLRSIKESDVVNCLEAVLGIAIDLLGVDKIAYFREVTTGNPEKGFVMAYGKGRGLLLPGTVFFPEVNLRPNIFISNPTPGVGNDAYLYVVNSGNGINGLLAIDDTSAARNFSLKEKRTVFALANLLTEVIGSWKFIDLTKRRACTDVLTSLPNRREISEIYEKEINRLVLGEISCLSVGMIDIDLFKKINDNHGHIFGDTVLKEFGNIVKNLKFQCGRWGGEEFLVIFPDVNLSVAAEKMEELKKEFLNTTFMPPKGTKLIRVSLSGGVTSATQETHNGMNLANHLRIRADELLYEAKKNGRNRICQGK